MDVGRWGQKDAVRRGEGGWCKMVRVGRTVWREAKTGAGRDGRKMLHEGKQPQVCLTRKTVGPVES